VSVKLNVRSLIVNGEFWLSAWDVKAMLTTIAATLGTESERVMLLELADQIKSKEAE